MGRRPAAGQVMSAYSTLAGLGIELPLTRVLTELLRQLTTATGAISVQLSRLGGESGDSGLPTVLTWPPQADRTTDLDDRASPGPTAPHRSSERAVIRDGTTVAGALTVVTDGAPWSDDDARRLRETVDCVLLVWRRDRSRTVLEQQLRHTQRLAGELSDSGRRLSTVRDLERRRVATEIITLSAGRLNQLHREADHLDARLRDSSGSASGSRLDEYDQATYERAEYQRTECQRAEHQPAEHDGSVTGRLRDLLDELIEDFRVMVRGIHPEVLATRGPRAALAEVAAGLPRPVRISGSVPARVDRELGSALYHLTARALQILARTGEDTLDVHLDHVDGMLAALVSGGARTSAPALRAALSVDTDRLSALGGGVDIGVEDAVVTMRAWVPDRLEPDARAPRAATSRLPDRVRWLALRLAAEFGTGAGHDRAQALITRLDGPVRLGVVGHPGAPDETGALGELGVTGDVGVPATLGQRLPDLLVQAYPSATRANGFEDQPDVVLQSSVDHPGERYDVVLAGAGTLIRSASWSALPALLATEVVARADLLRARSVLAELIGLLRVVPLTGENAGRLYYELEELQARADELAELEALAQLRTGTLGLTRSQLRVAERLLGCTGSAPHERLGLGDDATPEQLQHAAGVQLDTWRRMAENATAGRPQRQACGTIVRRCESMLTLAMSGTPQT